MSVQFGYRSDSNSPPRKRMEARALELRRQRQVGAIEVNREIQKRTAELRDELTEWRAEATRLKVRVSELEAKMAPEIAEPLFPRGTVKTIQQVVAAAYGLTLIDMLAHRQHRQLVRPRHVAMYLARELTTQSMPQIGRLFERRDHTTVLHACRKMDKFMAADPEFAKQVEALKALCLKAFAERVAP